MNGIVTGKVEKSGTGLLSWEAKGIHDITFQSDSFEFNVEMDIQGDNYSKAYIRLIFLDNLQLPDCYISYRCIPDHDVGALSGIAAPNKSSTSEGRIQLSMKYGSQNRLIVRTPRSETYVNEYLKRVENGYLTTS